MLFSQHKFFPYSKTKFGTVLMETMVAFPETIKAPHEKPPKYTNFETKVVISRIRLISDTGDQLLTFDL